MVDEKRILRLLRSVTDDISVLQAEAAADSHRRSDALWLRGIKYTFITAIEACVDAGQHICASEGWGPPADNGDVMRLLHTHGVLAEPTARAMRMAVGFRNVLVHEYVEVDDEIVLRRLTDLGDLRRFVEEIIQCVT
ncbi:DUF86 domain-containing protein [Hoyosella sp. YIM 151337]|uniref:type VII toxin-antitoxin system HepT family RNase toxin n=1 Tax=Hoyosella sp. YIM 151337 TaxID=2992742 RepID=UPI00223592F0|nr:DUF86 domain-containing protein [Hoyosella sp. YIM 151337]MCW4354224.1 DUF86 domain-containing protein [Hoyosella sp. YIM 151337]